MSALTDEQQAIRKSRVTANRLRKLLRYNPETGEFRWIKTRAGRAHAGSVAGCAMGSGYRRIEVDRYKYLAHRLAWLHFHGKWPEHDLDHINGNCDDNRIVNLREATHAENSRNRRKHVDNTSGFKGVTWDKNRGKWKASIGINGRGIFLGRHETPEAAHAAYCQAVAKYHGEFAGTL